eukprot:1825786-Rhodomonas_salina.1
MRVDQAAALRLQARLTVTSGSHRILADSPATPASRPRRICAPCVSSIRVVVFGFGAQRRQA